MCAGEHAYLWQLVREGYTLCDPSCLRAHTHQGRAGCHRPLQMPCLLPPPSFRHMPVTNQATGPMDVRTLGVLFNPSNPPRGGSIANVCKSYASLSETFLRAGNVVQEQTGTIWGLAGVCLPFWPCWACDARPRPHPRGTFRKKEKDNHGVGRGVGWCQADGNLTLTSL